jgi:hypothetical protein
MTASSNLARMRNVLAACLPTRIQGPVFGDVMLAIPADPS